MTDVLPMDEPQDRALPSADPRRGVVDPNAGPASVNEAQAAAIDRRPLSHRTIA